RNELNGYSLEDKGVWYVGPTFTQAKRNAWTRLKRLAAPVTKATYENEARVILINDREMEIKGADDPDSLHGVGLSYAGLDEYAKMRPDAWDVAIRPMLTDVKGGATFIGTLKGKNHFWTLAQFAKEASDWGYFEFTTLDNPFIDPAEVQYAREHMTKDAFREQYLAKPSTGGGKLLKSEWIKFSDEPKEGIWCIAVDLAGYVDEATTDSRYKQLDQTAIAIVKVHEKGWFCKDIRVGRWGVRETATKIIKACHDYDVRDPGIEKGALYNAVLPYLKDQQKKIGFFIEPMPLSHGGNKKPDRIVWALAGRMENGRLTFPHNAEGWLDQFIDQMADFPNPRAPDDLLDSLAYIDQIATLVGGTLSVSQYAGNLIDEMN
ncbi:MAG: hypothetical protein ACE5J5_08640, partial [Candidatus Hydrothermarchaeales archaeon]